MGGPPVPTGGGCGAGGPGCRGAGGRLDAGGFGWWAGRVGCGDDAVVGFVEVVRVEAHPRHGAVHRGEDVDRAESVGGVLGGGRLDVRVGVDAVVADVAAHVFGVDRQAVDVSEPVEQGPLVDFGFEGGRLLRPVVQAGHDLGALEGVLAAHGFGDAAAGVVADLPAAGVVEGEAVGEAEDDQAGRGLDGVGHLVVLTAAAEHRVLGDLLDHGNPSVGCWWWIPAR